MFLGDLTTPMRAKRLDIGGEAGPWPRWGRESPPNDLVICKRSRPILVLQERKTRLTLMSRLAGSEASNAIGSSERPNAGETVAAMMAAFRRLDPRMRGSFVGETVPRTVS